MKNSTDFKLRLLLRSVYLKGHQDGNLKTSDLSWEDKIVKQILSLVKECAPGEKPVSKHENHTFDENYCYNCQICIDEEQEPRIGNSLWNSAIKQFLANIEGEK